ncbi:MAG TPA: TetR/AcrR family transcriptional regulator [Elusimicrobiales bacterium]|nr:TetR/AcrR family transcriptional regulator [Elusimicrobiales bacterium]
MKGKNNPGKRLCGSTRERILEKAAQLFAEKGVDRVSVDEIVKAAGVTNPTLYYYFKSKHTLCEQVFAAERLHFTTKIKEALSAPGSLENKLSAYFKLHFELNSSSVVKLKSFRKIWAVPPTHEIEKQITDFCHASRENFLEFLRPYAQRGEIQSSRVNDVAHLVSCVLAYFFLNIHGPLSDTIDKNLPERLAHLIAESAKLPGKQI